jgi:hypothetical protein
MNAVNLNSLAAVLNEAYLGGARRGTRVFVSDGASTILSIATQIYDCPEDEVPPNCKWSKYFIAQ